MKHPGTSGDLATFAVALLALLLWFCWSFVSFFPFSSVDAEVIRGGWRLLLTLLMFSIGLIGLFMFRVSSLAWNLLHLMSLSLPFHLFALQAAKRWEAFIIISASGLPVVAVSSYIVWSYLSRRRLQTVAM